MHLNTADLMRSCYVYIFGASQVAQWVKNLPAMQEMWIWSLGWEDPLEEVMATHFLSGESHGQRSLAGYSPWGHKEVHTTERLSTRICQYSECSSQRNRDGRPAGKWTSRRSSWITYWSITSRQNASTGTWEVPLGIQGGSEPTWWVT